MEQLTLHNDSCKTWTPAIGGNYDVAQDSSSHISGIRTFSHLLENRPSSNYNIEGPSVYVICNKIQCSPG